MSKATSTWAVSSGSSDNDDLPSFSHVLSQRSSCKVEEIVLSSDEDDKCYISLTERLKKTDSIQEYSNFANNTKDVNNSENLTSVEYKKQTSSSNVSSPCPHQSPIKKTKALSKKQKTQESDEVRKRKAAQAELKDLKPEECLKNMTCLIGRPIEAMFDGASIIESMQSDSDATFQTVDIPDPVIRWQRKVRVHGGDLVEVTSQFHDEPDMLIVINAKDFIRLIYNENSKPCNDESSFSEWLDDIRVRSGNVTIRIVCIGLKKYNRQVHNKLMKEYKKSVLAAGSNSQPTQKMSRKNNVLELQPNEIEDALVEMQLAHEVNVLRVEKKEEFIELVKQITKSVGEAPYKRMKRQNIQFINEKSSVKINASTGDGCRRAWRQMLGQLHNVSPEMSAAVLSKYSSLSELMKAYETCPEEGCDLLSDVVIRRGVGTLENRRRLGPQLSKRIHKMFSSVDGNEILF